jgi:hypothetical protein
MNLFQIALETAKLVRLVSGDLVISVNSGGNFAYCFSNSAVLYTYFVAVINNGTKIYYNTLDKFIYALISGKIK